MISPFQLNQIINSKYLYFYGEFMYPFGFEQLIIVLYNDNDNDNEINKTASGAFILLNNKREKSYYKIFKKFKILLH